MRRLWDASARGDADALRAGYAPDAVLRAYGGPVSPRAGEFKGIEEILDYLASAGETVDDLRSDILEIYTSDGGVVLRYRTVATRGDKHLDMQYLYIAAIEAGRIVRATLVPTDQRRNDEFWRTH
jgi:ketosteroid isomerase-like protein